jgi:hypothetical protein
MKKQENIENSVVSQCVSECMKDSGFDSMPLNDKEWVHTKYINFESVQLVLDVYSPSEKLVLEEENDWSIVVLGKRSPLGILAYGEDLLKSQNSIKEKLDELQTWIKQKSIKKHLYTQKDYKQFCRSLSQK